MSEATPAGSFSPQEMTQCWAEAARAVVGQIIGSEASEQKIAPSGEAWRAATAAPVRFTFTLGGRLQGSLRILLSAADAVRLSQIFVGEPCDGSTEMSIEREDALGELLRQIAGAVATALRARLGGDVNFNLGADAQEAGDPASWAGLGLSGGPIGEPVIWINVSGMQAPAAAPAPAPAPAVVVAPPAPAAVQPAPAAFANPSPSPAAEPRPSEERTLEMLLGVHLDVVLRFGEQQLTLGEILELTSGAVVELDRQVNEPAELLVGGRVIARGDIVIVDGNYGLRVTEMVSPEQRIRSLSA